MMMILLFMETVRAPLLLPMLTEEGSDEDDDN